MIKGEGRSKSGQKSRVGGSKLGGRKRRTGLGSATSCREGPRWGKPKSALTQRLDSLEAWRAERISC